MRLIDAISAETGALEREIRHRFAHDDRVRRLLPISGIGLLTAALVVAEVWEVSRFPSADKLCSWAGLTPSEHSSAEHTRRGHISKQGSRWLRWAMVEAATRPRLAPEFRRFYDPIARRRGKFIARVALAGSHPHCLLLRPPARDGVPGLPDPVPPDVGPGALARGHGLAWCDGRCN